MYLMIQNPGVAPVEGFLYLGVSTTRDSGVAGTIGKFGSGTKHAVNVCLRANLQPQIFCGLHKLEYYVKTKTVQDDLTAKQVGIVHCKQTGKTTDGKQISKDKELGFSIDYGAYDWPDLAMALREYVSNAIDRTIRGEGGFEAALKDARLSVEVVGDNQVRAKDSFTRVFLPFTMEVQKFFSELGKRFLHFSEPELLSQKILPKRDRNFGAVKTAMIYRNGVLVREVADQNPSLFDYNFGGELAIDESRNLSDYDVRYHATLALRDAPKDVLAKVYKSMLAGETSWESTFDSYYLSTDRIFDQTKRTQQREVWNQAFEAVAGDGLLVEDDQSQKAEQCRRKGYKTVALGSKSWTQASAANAVQTAESVLTADEKEGREVIPATVGAQQAVDTVWGWLEEVRLTMGKEKPVVMGFRAIMKAESETFGYWNPVDQKVYINEAHSNGGLNKRVLQTALEECVHHVTQAGDSSRDLQAFLFKMIVEKFVQ
jgi:hypothetical protein